jgi:hypothetical protein
MSQKRHIESIKERCTLVRTSTNQTSRCDLTLDDARKNNENDESIRWKFSLLKI